MSEMRALAAFPSEVPQEGAWDDDRQRLERKVGALEESNRRLREELHSMRAGKLFVGVPDPATSPRRPSACIPMWVDGVVVGAIAIFRLADRRSGLSGADFDLLEMLGMHVGTALVATRDSISPA